MLAEGKRWLYVVNREYYEITVELKFNRPSATLVDSYLGDNWGSGLPRFPDEMALGYTKHVISKGGVVSWDVPIAPSGLLPDAFVRQLKVIGNSR